MPRVVYKHKSNQGFQKGYTPWNKGRKGNTLGFQKGQKNKNWNGFQKGHKSGMTGKKHTEETKKKQKESKLGNKNHNWLDGKSFELYTLNWTKTLRQFIRERDHYVCQLCNSPQQERLHSIHHIDYIKQNCNPNNLITLCVSCNSKVNKNREYWTKYFQQIL